MTSDERDPRSGQGRGSDEVVYDFNGDDTGDDPIIDTILWEGRYPTVTSNEHRWLWTPDNNSAAYCGSRSIRMISKVTGAPYSATFTCTSWGHEPHAIEKAKRIIWHLTPIFAALPGVWYTTFRGTKTARERLRQRRKQPNDWLSVLRTNGTVAYFSSRELPGRLPPNEWAFLPPDVALYVLASCALALPGIKRVDGPWKPPEKGEEPSGRNWGLGIMKDEVWYAAVDAAVDVLGDRYGAPWDPWESGAELPGKIPAPVFADTVADNLVAIRRAGSRFNHGGE